MFHYLANIITLTRIPFSFLLLFTKILSPSFYLFYTLCGVTDVLDGFIARKTHTTSKLGALLDSLADLVFFVIIGIKLIPLLILRLPSWILWAIIVIALIRCLSYIIGAIKYHQFTILHTLLNKTTGLFIFILPYFLSLAILPTVYLLCLIALISSLEELYIIFKSTHFDPNISSLFKL